MVAGTVDNCGYGYACQIGSCLGSEFFMLKTDPHPDYPATEGCFLRGNDYSPVAVAVAKRAIDEEDGRNQKESRRATNIPDLKGMVRYNCHC